MHSTGNAKRSAPLRPLSARSVALSLMLGAESATVPARTLLVAGAKLGVEPATMRVALHRMVTAGDVARVDEGTYELSERLRRRQRRQELALAPSERPWRGGWEMAVVTATGRPSDQRLALRAELAELRLGELREGVWLRPDNLERAWPEHLAGVVARFSAEPAGNAPALVGALWDLEGWADEAHALLSLYRAGDTLVERLAPAAAIVRHLLGDPVLPVELEPHGWPATVLREASQEYHAQLRELASTL